MKISKIDIRILTDLYKSVDGLIPYIFFKRYRYSPSVVYKSTSKFIKKGFIKEEDEKLFLTREGRKFLEKNNFTFSKNKFDKIPKEFKQTKLEINKPYLPNVQKLQKEILILQHKDDG